MKRFFTFLKTELKLSVRDMNMPIFAVIMPLVIFVILGVIYGGRPSFDGAPYTYTETDKLVTDNFDIETASPEQLRERLIDTETAAKILLGEGDA